MPSVRSSPARLGQARNQALETQVPDLDPVEAELAIDATRTSGGGAAVAHAGRVSVARNLGQLEARDQTLALVARLVVRDRLEARVLRRILLHKLLAPLVLVDGTQFRHGLKLSWAAYAACFSSAWVSDSGAGNGKPNRRSSSRASSSVFAVVVTMMSIPRTFSILS